MWETYRRIQAFKAAGTAYWQGVNFARVVAIYLYDRSLSGTARQWVFALLFQSAVVLTGDPNAPVRFWYSARRKRRADCDFMIERAFEIAGRNASFYEETERLRPTQFFCTLLHLPRAWTLTRDLDCGSIRRVTASLLIAKYYSSNLPKAIRSVDGATVVVTFCDLLPSDNMVAQLANLLGIRTVTLQHGQYRVLDETNMSVDAETYCNFISDVMLSWGDRTTNDLSAAGVPSDRFYNVGWIRNWPEVARTDHTEVGNFGVMLNGPNGQAASQHLLTAAEELAEKLEVSYVVRTHPSTEVARIANMVGPRCIDVGPRDLPSYLASVSFSIAHMTGAVIECLHYRSPVYLLADGNLPTAFDVEGVAYDSVERMLIAIQQDMNDPTAAVSRMTEVYKQFDDCEDQVRRVRLALQLD